jgi:hypothetical protein
LRRPYLTRRPPQVAPLVRLKGNSMKYSMFALVVAVFALAAPPAQAVGCFTGAVAGAVAGHYAGHHAVLGAIGGCIAGHHLRKVQQEKKQEQQQTNQPPAAPQ